MKRIMTLLLAILIACSFSFSAFATGDVIVGGDGDDMGDGTGENKTLVGGEGVRITVYGVKSGNKYGETVDFTNVDWRNNFQKVRYSTKGYSKVDYTRGISIDYLDENSYNNYYVPENMLPNIIQDINGSINIPLLKKHFKSKKVIREVIQRTHCDLDIEDFETGKFCLLLEPVGYFYFEGETYALTATEVAILNQMQTNAGVTTFRSKLTSFTHQNLPLAMFLDEDTTAGQNLGLNVWRGTTSGRVNDSDIINNLGNALVIYKEDEKVEEKPDTPADGGAIGGITGSGDYDYPCDSDVITSLYISSSDTDITNSNSATASFNINGEIHEVTGIVMPAGEQQLVWVKWHTPSTPQTINIGVDISGGLIGYETISANIYEVIENEPPDPTGTDTNPGIKNLSKTNCTTTKYKSDSWSVWYCYTVWHEHKRLILNKKTGEIEEETYYTTEIKFAQHTYSAGVRATMDITPDSRVPTDEKCGNTYKLKSGYGLDIEVENNVVKHCNICDFAYTPYAVATFPEFEYKTYNRVLDREFWNYMTFKPNEWSQFEKRVHFNPVWFPDGIYEMKLKVFSFWTPNGEITFDLSDYVYIDGAVYDDYYVRPVE